MQEETLHAIVAVEREIEELLASERRQAAERLTELRAACDRRLSDARARLPQEPAVEEDTVRQAREQAAAIVAEAAAEAGRLDRVSDAELIGLLRRELRRLLPDQPS